MLQSGFTFFCLVLAALIGGVGLTCGTAAATGEADGRFIQYDNGTVLDTQTQLMWMTRDYRNIEGRLTQNMGEALAWVRKMNTLRYAGYADWRVPSLEEFQSIYDKRRPGRSYRNARVGYPVVFENGGGEFYWVFQADRTDHWLSMHPHIITFRSNPYDLINADRGEDDPNNSVRLVRSTYPPPPRPLPERATPPRPQRIAILKSHDLAPFNLAWAGFSVACRPHTKAVDTFDLQGGAGETQDVVKRVIAGHYALVVAIGPLAAKIASAEIKDIPVVIVMTPHPQQNGWIAKNVAGIALHIAAETQFATYKTLLPGMQTIGVVYNPANTGGLVDRAREVARQMGLHLLTRPVASPKAVPDALRNLLDKVDALWLIPDETVVSRESFKFFALTTLAHRLPFLVMTEVFVEVGALAGVSSDYLDIGRQACQLARDITSGRQRPDEVGVVPPEKANLAINLKVARQLGLEIPKSLVESANKLFQ